MWNNLVCIKNRLKKCVDGLKFANEQILFFRLPYSFRITNTAYFVQAMKKEYNFCASTFRKFGLFKRALQSMIVDHSNLQESTHIFYLGK